MDFIVSVTVYFKALSLRRGLGEGDVI